MNFTSVYGIWGDEKGINIYKYFDLHTLIAVVLGQTLISYFGNEYVYAVLFFAGLNVVAIVVVFIAPFPDKVKNSELMDG